MKKSAFKEYIINVENFSGGINNYLSPYLLTNQVVDANNVYFDDIISVAKKCEGFSLYNNNFISGRIPIRAINYKRDDKQNFIVVCALNSSNNKYEVWYCIEGITTWTRITEAESDYSFNFAVFQNILWIVNKVVAPIVFNGVEVKILNGVGVDWNNNAIADFSLTNGMSAGNYIVVYQNSIVMANTFNNGSEIIFSRFVDDNGNIIPATSQKAWVNINSILVSPDDNDDITSIIPYFNSLCVFKSKSLYVINGILKSPTIIKIPTNNGAINNDAVCVHKNILFYLSNDGVYAFDGVKVEKVSTDIEKYFYNLQPNIQKEIRLSKYIEFLTARQSSSNLMLTEGFDFISMPKNILLSDGRDFFANEYKSSNIEYKNGIKLVSKILPTCEEKSSANIVSKRGEPSYISDGSFNSFYGVRMRGDEEANIKFVYTFKQNVNVQDIEMYLSFKVDTEIIVALSDRSDYKNEIEYSFDDKNWVKIYRKYGYKDVVYDYENKEVNIKVSVKNINFSTNRIFFRFRFLGYSAESSGVNKKIHYLNLKIYAIQVNYLYSTENSGYYITRWLDTYTSSPTYSTLTWTEYKPSGTNILVYFAGTNNINTDLDNVSWTQINRNQTPSLNTRYVAYRIVLSTSTTTSPVVSDFKQTFSSSAQYIGRRTLSVSPTWKKFFVQYTTNSGSLTFYVSPNGSTWTQVQNGSSLSFLGSSQNIWFRVDMTRSGDSGAPVVNAIVSTYDIENVVDRIYSSVSYNNRLFISMYKTSSSTIPDRVLVFNKTNVWSHIDDLKLYCFVKDSDKLLCCLFDENRTKLFEFLKENVYDKTVIISFKHFILGSPTEVFLIRKIWIHMYPSINTPYSRFTLRIYNLKSPTPIFTKEITYVRSSKTTNPIEINCNLKVFQFTFDIKQEEAYKTDDFALSSVQFLIRPLRILSKEE